MKQESLSIITVKTLLAVVIFTGIGTIIIGGVYLIGKQKNDKLNKILPVICKNNFDCPLQMKCKNYICVDVGCLEKGESLPGAINPKYTNHMATECCRGLKRITVSKYYDTDCNIQMYPLGGSISICSNCGNGICEENLETKCNCPEDCEEEDDTADWQTYRNEEYGFEVKYPEERWVLTANIHQPILA
jgi:hypothetical protein